MKDGPVGLDGRLSSSFLAAAVRGVSSSSSSSMPIGRTASRLISGELLLALARSAGRQRPCATAPSGCCPDGRHIGLELVRRLGRRSPGDADLRKASTSLSARLTVKGPAARRWADGARRVPLARSSARGGRCVFAVFAVGEAVLLQQEERGSPRSPPAAGRQRRDDPFLLASAPRQFGGRSCFGGPAIRTPRNGRRPAGHLMQLFRMMRRIVMPARLR